MDPYQTLPNEVFEKILQDIRAEDLKSVGVVCKEWKSFIDDDWAIWKYYCQGFDETIIEKDSI